MIFFDASFLIAFYLKNDKYNKKAIKVWEKNKNKEKIINKTTLYEFLTVLKNKNIKKANVKKYYNEIINNTIILEDEQLHNKTVEACLNNELSFFDNLHHLTMVENGIKEIASFDPAFDMFDDIKRIA